LLIVYYCQLLFFLIGHNNVTMLNVYAILNFFEVYYKRCIPPLLFFFKLKVVCSVRFCGLGVDGNKFLLLI
jgi:hypothetical protein